MCAHQKTANLHKSLTNYHIFRSLARLYPVICYMTCKYLYSVIIYFVHLKGAAEPMQVDGQVEENDNVEEDQFVVENSSMVSQ